MKVVWKPVAESTSSTYPTDPKQAPLDHQAQQDITTSYNPASFCHGANAHSLNHLGQQTLEAHDTKLNVEPYLGIPEYKLLKASCGPTIPESE